MSQDPGFNPYASPLGPGLDQPVMPAVKSGAVTTVAVMNFVFGALWLLCGTTMTISGGMLPSFLPPIMEQIANDPNATEMQRQQMDQLKEIGIDKLGIILLAIGVVMIVLALPTIAAGIGVMKRRNWGRILTIVVGIICAVFAVVSLVQLNICGVLIYAGYSGTVLAILFNPRYAAEFS